jgi:demethylmenaquinone methyltransferase / 2-methoxy-6-polyprenyl-1,4-benzoquinol methylase
MLKTVFHDFKNFQYPIAAGHRNGVGHKAITCNRCKKLMQDPGLSMSRSELEFVREMFDGIAPHYDLLNRLLSLRQDVRWRRALVSGLALKPGDRMLDAACGTADVGLEVARQTCGAVEVMGIDFAPQMLRLAAAKIKVRPGSANICLAAADAFHLPFASGGFDAVSMAFGIRNIQDKATVLRAFWEQLKPGGRLAILELGIPVRKPLRRAYLFYFNRLLPVIGRLFSSHSFAYSYLPRSVARFPEAGEFAALMRRAGFARVRFRRLSLGITVLFVGDKPR